MPAFTKYGLEWPEETPPLVCELHQIKHRLGNLPFHYKNACKIIWPHIDWHRWTEICNNEIRRPGAKVTVIMGSGSCGKTAISGWEYLLEYYASPDDTLVLISSTDMRSLELRVWGEIKMLHERALELFPYLPGHLIDSKHCITTDDIDDDELDDRIKTRDLRKGIMGIPTVQGGKNVGLGKWCFPSGTLVDTPAGKVPIEEIKTGDIVLSAIGERTVTATCSRRAEKIVRVSLSDGGSFDCTPEHPILTSSGWVNAVDILPETQLYSTHETMRILREGISGNQSAPEVLLQEVQVAGQENLPGLRRRGDGEREVVLHGSVPEKNMGEGLQVVRSGLHPIGSESGFLFALLRSEMEDESAGDCPKDDSWEGLGCSGKGHQSRHQEKSQGTLAPESAGKEEFYSGLEKSSSKRGDENREHHLGNFPGSGSQFSSQHRPKLKEASLPATLSDRRGVAETETGGGDRWELPPDSVTVEKGCGERFVPEIKRVVSVTVLQPDGDARYSASEGGYLVHNLQVEGHPSYSVSGVVVHNCGIKQVHIRLVADDCTAMSSTFLSAFANLNNNVDFQAVVLGNPDDMLDPLGISAEPVDGWSSHMEPTKTATWDTKFYNGRCVNLVGTDSPNFDFPADKPPRYPYLVSQKKINETISAFGRDSFEYYSQCIGVMKISQLSRRVITRDLCHQFKAQEDVIWGGESAPVRIGALDAAYGGDRCIGGYAEFGRCVDGKVRLLFHPPHHVPVRVKTDELMAEEDQISRYEKQFCESNSVAPENFFHDSTGRGSLGTSLSRLWSAHCNPIEFGGTPTRRPVTMDMFITDKQTGERRLKRCDEHYLNFVTELWYSLRFAIESDQVRGLPDDVMQELCMREWHRKANDKIQVETKEDMKVRSRKSPDLGDWAAICLEGARRKGFQISKLGGDLPGKKKKDWLDEQQRSYGELMKSTTLQHL